MREKTLMQAMALQDKATTALRLELQTMRKVLDRTYLQNLTHVMMWDVLFGLLQEKGLFTKAQFDEALADLAKKTQAAMEAAQKAAEGPELPFEGDKAVPGPEPAKPLIP